jgi:hypothetical protein
VSKKLNRWYDHGEGIGGNVIDLICLITKGTVKEALKIIEQEGTSFFLHRKSPFRNEEETEFKPAIGEIKELGHIALKGYLKSRNIAITTARKLVKEIHYDYNDRTYFAIGLKNNSGGWELRNKYYKSSTSPKDISHIRNGKDRLIITEGMFDMLSIIETCKDLHEEYDFLVLNSTAFISKAREIMKGYLQIELYLDNATNGQRTAEKLTKRSKNCQDRSALYPGFKDMNQWLIHLAKKGLGQEARDVSLLPQKQTRFTPDGRKERKK